MENKFLCSFCKSKIPCSAYNFGNECEEEVKYRKNTVNTTENLPTKNQEMLDLLKELFSDLERGDMDKDNQSYYKQKIKKLIK